MTDELPCDWRGNRMHKTETNNQAGMARMEIATQILATWNPLEASERPIGETCDAAVKWADGLLRALARIPMDLEQEK
jgi:hypothetical protein